MSRVYFHSIDDESELRGSERAYAGWLTSNIGIAALDLANNEDALRASLGASVHHGSLDLQLRVDASRMAFRLADGRTSNAWEVLLNTCIDMGSEALCLLAHMHGQCEIHAFVDGKDRAWLADVIARGRRFGVLRANQGWEAVAAHLVDSDEHPVVMSYSVCDGFPNKGVAGFAAEGDAWYDKPREEQWTLCMAKLRAQPGMRMGSDTLTTVGFGDGMNAFNVIEGLKS